MTTILKKHGLPEDEYRPISDLSVNSKLLERLIAEQCGTYNIEENKLLL